MKGTNPHTSKTNSIDVDTIRLNKFISNAGICSRRAADNLILEGRIKVNNSLVRELSVGVKE